MTEASDNRPTVRRAAMGDLPVIVAFNAALALETESKQLDPPTLRQGVEAALKDGRRCAYFVAEIADTVVGQTMITFEWSDWRNRWFWWLQSVYVRPESRGRGVFKALYKHVYDACRAAPDAVGLRLYVAKKNERARTAYLRL
jgi:GNAT superfamily N-acetyltransferase